MVNMIFSPTKSRDNPSDLREEARLVKLETQIEALSKYVLDMDEEFASAMDDNERRQLRTIIKLNTAIEGLERIETTVNRNTGDITLVFHKLDLTKTHPVIIRETQQASTPGIIDDENPNPCKNRV